MSLRREINSAMEDHIEPEKQVDAFYDSVSEPGFDWGPPNTADFKYVMSQFADLVSRETKKASIMGSLASPQKRADVITYIMESIAARPVGVFANVDAYVFGVQLALRVRRPRSTNQGSSNLCGPVSVLYTFAKSNPAGFAQFALDLFQKGQGMFNQMLIEPSPKIKANYAIRKNNIPHMVDYVTLVSLRQCTFISDSLGFNTVRGADETTLAGQLGRWLNDAGYTNVQDHTFFAENQQFWVNVFATGIGQPMHMPGATAGQAVVNDGRKKHALASLQQAEQAVRQGKIVIMFSDGEVGDALKNGSSLQLGARSDATKIGTHHWMALRKCQFFGDTHVKLKVITWGASYQGAFKTEALVSRYNGFISADP